MGPQAPYSWTMWEYLWEAESPGEYTILARATSSRGRVQPARARHAQRRLPHSPQPAACVCASPPAAARPSIAHAQTILYDMNAFAEENMRLPLDVEMEFSAGEGI